MNLIIKGGDVVLLDARVIPVVRVPNRAVLSSEDIRKRLIGQTLKYYDFNSSKIYEITTKTLVTFKELVIFPSLKEDVLEVRLCRELEVRMGPEEIDSYARWAVFVDAITGEMVHQNYLLVH